MNFPSKLIEDAVKAFSQLPGIGKKTALRLVLHLLKQSPEMVTNFGDTITKMRHDIKFCKTCHNISDHEECSICANPKRDRQLVCVVETIRDVIAIENTNQFRGTFHVLGGVISPIDGIGPDNLNLVSLEERVKNDKVKELIMALNPTMEGDTTVFYISKKLKETGVTVTLWLEGFLLVGN
ncbi:MAG: recombination mediator RecR [Chitinophagales bacterium]